VGNIVRFTGTALSSSKLKSAAPQFPGVEFRATEVALTGDAPDNDLAIRSSLVYFKHRWPGQAAELTGPLAFRLKAWAIAQEVGLPIKGGRPQEGTVTVYPAPSTKGK
jgi:hypothetical protein